MNNNKNILFIGLGSIGQRHLRNYKLITKDNSGNLYAYRTSNKQLIIENGRAINCDNLSKHYGFKDIFNIEEAIDLKPGICFICNPSKFHIDAALKFVKTGSALFIEKPLGTQIDGLNAFKKTLEEKNNITMIGFQTRFHPYIKETKRILSERKFGNVISARFNWSTFLPDHHPYEDYRDGYAARKDLGGGVIFSLIHEMDLIQFFFGIPYSVYTVGGAISKLGINVVDTANSIFLCKGKDKNFSVSLTLSFAQKVERRAFEIIMDDAMLECDLIENKIRVVDNKDNIIIDEKFDDLKRNDLFIAEMKHFLHCIDNSEGTGISVSEGEKSLLMALAMHRSIDNGTIEKI